MNGEAENRIDDEAEEARGRRMDPEILAMQRLVREAEALPPGSRPRVLAWLAARYLGPDGRP